MDENTTFGDIAPNYFNDLDNIDWNLWNTMAMSAASATMDETLLELDSLIGELTGYNTNPYDALKAELFGEDYVFPSLSSIQIPSLGDAVAVLPLVDKHIRDVNNDVIDILNANETLNIADLDFVGFKKTVNGESVVNVAKLKSYIELLELAREANTALNDSNVKEISRKLICKCGEFCRL